MMANWWHWIKTGCKEPKWTRWDRVIDSYNYNARKCESCGWTVKKTT